MKVGENMAKKTHEQFLKDMKDVGLVDIEPLDKYIGAKTKIRFKCLKPGCDCVWEMSPNKLLRKNKKYSKCPKCREKELVEKQNKNNKQFLQELHEHGIDNIKLIDNYVNNHTKIKVKCLNPNCNHEWSITPSNLLKSLGCPKCSKKIKGNYKRKTNEEFMEEFNKVGNPNLKVISEYKGRFEEIWCECNKGHKFNTTPGELLNGTGCPFCSGKRVDESNCIKTLRPDLIQYLKDKEDAERYTLGSGQKIWCKCPICGVKKEMLVYDLVHYGFSCSICDDGISFPNKFIRNFLKMNNISFKFEWIPKWEKDFNYRYDVFFELNNKKYLIEADGPQHQTKIFMGKESSLSDKIKDDWAKNNGYIMIRIDCSYSDGFYIYNKMKETILADLFNLNDFDWKKCTIESQKNLTKVVCDYFNEHPDYSYIRISKELELGMDFVRDSIRKGYKLGICMQLSKYSKKKKIGVIIYKNNKIIKKVESIKEAIKFIGEKESSSIYKKINKNGYYEFENYRIEKILDK